MVSLTSRAVPAALLVTALVLAGAVGPGTAQTDCGTACLDPGGDRPDVDAGPPGFTTPVVELFLKAKKAFTDEFQAFLKAKKAF
ncbi:hypothetical protein DU500_02920 [Haloplanus rubicundus]|uniref:Uncharacterized protein n=1 Tax=Haloplanus rubicundus TaxID=1547898 RepID=A0A345DZU8_9EURY|nr:hypothetical protein [Haloplanus rubicundus]AXG05470.1 hypothetical protein DU500_02920 [Haloplanus rubicundus]AXG08824.1 hypothetical protein DU484_02515 [Haloplanus rubicundus]